MFIQQNGLNYNFIFMKNCVFTIVATNYVGLAQALQKSIEKYNKVVDFYIVVADETAGEVK